VTFPKVASTSVAHAMAARGVAMFSREGWISRPEPVVAIIRDPVDRLLSAHRFFLGQPKGFPPPFTTGMPRLDTFVNVAEQTILAGTANQHWQPQSEQVERVDMVVPYERLSEFWQRVMGDPPLPHENASQRAPIELDRSMLSQIGRMYETDAQMHAEAVDRADETLEALEWAAAQRA
jgi:hypothetical protein